MGHSFEGSSLPSNHQAINTDYIASLMKLIAVKDETIAALEKQVAALKALQVNDGCNEKADEALQSLNELNKSIQKLIKDINEHTHANPFKCPTSPSLKMHLDYQLITEPTIKEPL